MSRNKLLTDLYEFITLLDQNQSIDSMHNTLINTYKADSDEYAQALVSILKIKPNKKNVLKYKLITLYEDLHRHLNSSLPHIRQTNLYRNIFHATNGCLLFLLTYLLNYWDLSHWIPFAMFSICFAMITIDVLKTYPPIMKLLQLFIHQHEKNKLSSASWYIMSICIVCVCLPKTLYFSIIVLAFSDPLAAIIGRRYGKIQIIRGRTVEGSITFFITATISLHVAAFLTNTYEWNPTTTLITAAIFATLGELITFIDDNFTIPIMTALGIWIGNIYLS